MYNKRMDKGSQNDKIISGIFDNIEPRRNEFKVSVQVSIQMRRTRRAKVLRRLAPDTLVAPQFSPGLLRGFNFTPMTMATCTKANTAFSDDAVATF